jgi:hypothetical protein
LSGGNDGFFPGWFALIADCTWFRNKFARCFISIAILMGLHGEAGARTQLNLRENAVPPIAHAVFCMNYPRECSESAAAASFFSAPAQALYAVLVVVNRYVNTAIRPIRVTYRNILDDRWLLSPLSGNCNDYAVSKATRAFAFRLALRVAVAGGGRACDRGTPSGPGRKRRWGKLRARQSQAGRRPAGSRGRLSLDQD